MGAERYALAELIAQAAGEDLHAAATRVWAAHECLKKAGAAANAPLVLLAMEKDRRVLLNSGNQIIATCIAALEYSQNAMGLAILAEKATSALRSQPAPKVKRICAPTNTATS